MHPIATSIYTVQFDIVHGCQLRCVGCPNSTLLPEIKRISVLDFDRALRNIDVERIHTLRLFNFGEPLLHNQLADIVACIPKQKWKASVVEISTNAQKVNWDDFEEMIKLEVVTRLVVSGDGNGTPEDYERLRPPSRWERLIEFLERARALRDKWAPGMQLITRNVCEADPPENRQRWRDLLVPRGWTPEFRRWMALPEAVSNMTGREIVSPSKVCGFLQDASAFKGHPWHGEINLLYVDADGTVVPCCLHPQAGNLGNLFSQTFNEILASRKRKDFIKFMERQRQSMPICNKCEMGPVGEEGASFWAAMDVVSS
jgi:radical SAM protein with 4Fe4S-binding SPASM domain